MKMHTKIRLHAASCKTYDELLANLERQIISLGIESDDLEWDIRVEADEVAIAGDGAVFSRTWQAEAVVSFNAIGSIEKQGEQNAD